MTHGKVVRLWWECPKTGTSDADYDNLTGDTAKRQKVKMYYISTISTQHAEGKLH